MLAVLRFTQYQMGFYLATNTKNLSVIPTVITLQGKTN